MAQPDPAPETTSTKRADFQVLASEPWNGQPPPERLVAAPVTPLEDFFVRTHAPIPRLDSEELRLEVGGMVRTPLRLRLADLQANFLAVETTSALQCAGNRREELTRLRPLPGEVPWGISAIGNATWRGVALAEVLAAVGVLDGARHVAFLGLDRVEKHGVSFGFGGSIPLAKALDPDVLLAWEMNGEPLRPEHGGPLRVVVPGYIGARSVKWLGQVSVQLEPSDNYYQRAGYRLFPAAVEDAGQADPAAGIELGELSVSSAICRPADGAELDAGTAVVEGWAMAGGSRTVERVEVTADHGGRWTVAELGPGGAGSWRLWRAEIDLEPGPHELACRAFDSAANSQPEEIAAVWNCKGYMNNAWHRVRVWAG